MVIKFIYIFSYNIIIVKQFSPFIPFGVFLIKIL